MREWTKTKAATEAEVTAVEKTRMTDTDLEQLKVVLNGSQRTLQNVARWCKQKKGIKFGQNITSFIKNKKARRQKLHYSKEEVQQETVSPISEKLGVLFCPIFLRQSIPLGTVKPNQV